MTSFAPLGAVEVLESSAAPSGGLGVAQQTRAVAVLQACVAVEDALEVMVELPTTLAGGLSPLDDCLDIVE